MFNLSGLRKKFRENMQKTTWGFFSIITFLVLWHFFSTLTSKTLIPSPVNVLVLFFKSFIEPIGEYTLFGHIGWSLYRVLVGYLLASFIGITMGVAMGANLTIRAIVRPIFEMLRPLAISGQFSFPIKLFSILKFFIIYISAVVPATLNAFDGTIRVDPLLVGAAKMLGANTRQVFTRVVLPSSVPSIFAGLQVGLSASWAAVLAAEMIRSSEGTGWLIIMGMQYGNTTQVLAGMVSIAIVGMILVSIMRGVEEKLCVWNRRSR